ncbi:hypothetical protein RB4456 [Rhodopirellula baltica SH 1]|uniref:Uncharacterized protein n=1 Tax=Rhodopirellula baltica (strain DSM 10527 / NCIMB 13988 / SH1) TaxID=243090 RepID=Q7USK1_RHOBA|nr:hypothetical protein RB4456 [Rhodopirellula baltica SH 1]
MGLWRPCVCANCHPGRMKKDRRRTKNRIRCQDSKSNHFAVQRSARLYVGAMAFAITVQMPKDSC